MIKTSNLSKKFDDFQALDNINIHVKKGSIYGLIGPNGAGKSTLIKILVGVYHANDGQVLLDNEECKENNEIKQKIIYIPDDLYFFPRATVKSMAVFYSRVYRQFDWERYEKIKNILNIDEKKKISKFSKGMKRQVAFWLAICTKPEIMILDEPVDGLDPVMRKQIWSMLLQDVAEREMTVLISSHNLRELEDVCDHVGMINDGKLLLERNLDSLKSDIHKVQVVLPEGVTIPNLEILKEEKIGRLVTWIVKGDGEILENIISQYDPLVLEFIPLTLEEIFIYEFGGQGYEVKNIVI